MRDNPGSSWCAVSGNLMYKQKYFDFHFTKLSKSLKVPLCLEYLNYFFKTYDRNNEIRVEVIVKSYVSSLNVKPR